MVHFFVIWDFVKIVNVALYPKTNHGETVEEENMDQSK